MLLLVDTVLQENGLADSAVSLFRACTLCFVHLPKPSADAPARASPPPASGGLLLPVDAPQRSMRRAARGMLAVKGVCSTVSCGQGPVQAKAARDSAGVSAVLSCHVSCQVTG